MSSVNSNKRGRMLNKSQLIRLGLATKLKWQGIGTHSTLRTISAVSARLSRQITNQKNLHQSALLARSSLGIDQKSSFKTSAVQNDSCLPTPLPPKCGPKNCTIPRPNIFKDCKLKKRPKWTGCEKICMPCCCPLQEPPDCDAIEIRQNTCKRPEYRIPAFSECRKYPLIQRIKKECCYNTTPCPEAGIETIIEPLVSTKVRQETILGRRKGGNFRAFSTSAAASAKNDCKKAGNLPCLKPSGITQKKSKKNQNKDCTKQCMPCCRPAREPPECYYPYVKTECTRLKPPRPSFSECEKNKVKNIPECECVVGPLPPCKSQAGSSFNSC